MRTRATVTADQRRWQILQLILLTLRWLILLVATIIGGAIGLLLGSWLGF
jgi:hypothetical protein